MKNLYSKLSFISLIYFILASTSLHLSHSRTILPIANNLIEQTCQKTPDHDLCVSSLLKDPRAPGADVRGLAIIMVEIMRAKAQNNLNYLNQLLPKSPKLLLPLRSCASRYNSVLKGDIPQAMEALEKGNFKFAEEGANDAANEANSCERGFSGNISPITDKNKEMQDVSAVAAAIVRQLL